MIFHSLDFLAFFVITLAAYWSMPRRDQNVLMLVASYIFYGWVHPWWPVLLLVTTVTDYWAARGIEERPQHRRQFLWFSIAANLLLLGVYKYFNFFAENVQVLASSVGWTVTEFELRLALPAGISFYTFQSMSYTIDVYKGHAPARRRFLDVAAFVSFFPHLVAGPIMRATNLLPQFERDRVFDPAAARDATVLMVWGFFKKLVIADNVGIIANKVFALRDPDWFVLWAGVFAFAIQIYADFSAYTDIARGVAKWYGFDLIINFERPYLATGPRDFWRRWNISLSTWFRDYVYIPLGGARRGPARTAINLMVTFLVSGFWHGASWNYVLWGAYHGTLLLIERGIDGLGVRVPSKLRVLGVVVMFPLTCVGWLIFRETELAQLWHDVTLSPFASDPFNRSAGLYLFVLAAIYSLPLWIHDIWAESGAPNLISAIANTEPHVRWPRVAAQGLLCGVLVMGILALRSEATLNFIYFAF